MKVAQYIFRFLLLSCIVFFISTFSTIDVLANTPDLLLKGDNARLMGDYPLAEKIYTEALTKEPENYRILKSLVEVKVVLEKYAEAKPLADKAMGYARRALCEYDADACELIDGPADQLRAGLDEEFDDDDIDVFYGFNINF